MVGGRPVGEGDVGARQQEPGEIGTGALISADDCSGPARGGGGSGHRRFCLSLCVASSRPDKFVISMETSVLPRGLRMA